MGTRLAVIGGGNMGAALVGGLLERQWCRPDEIVIVEKLAPQRQALAARFPGVTTTELVVAADGVLLAVKPNDVAAACHGLLTDRVLSVAAGVTIATIEAALPGPIPVVRAMSNTPALVGAGASAIAPGSHSGEADMAWASEILSSVGTVSRVSEHLLDAVTGLSGSGPAYVFLVAEALIEAGVLNGLPRATARDLTVQLLVGSARLLAESGQDPGELRASVTSPGGTTAAGLRELERVGVRVAFLDAVTAATRRSHELGQS